MKKVVGLMLIFLLSMTVFGFGQSPSKEPVSGGEITLNIVQTDVDVFSADQYQAGVTDSYQYQLFPVYEVQTDVAEIPLQTYQFKWTLQTLFNRYSLWQLRQVAIKTPYKYLRSYLNRWRT